MPDGSMGSVGQTGSWGPGGEPGEQRTLRKKESHKQDCASAGPAGRLYVG